MQYTLLLKLYVYFWLAVFGACIGSFLNVVIYRLPRGSFFAQARSHCPDCGKQLGWRDLIPVAGFILLKGKCRYCGARISPRYPLVEAACAALAIFCFMRFGPDFRAALAFCVCAILLAVALIDYDTMEIPDRLVLALVPFAVCAVWLWPDTAIIGRVIGFFVISLPMLLLAVFINGAFGGGDIKLMAVCGFLLGWQNSLLAFFIALLIGGGCAIYLLASGKSKRGAHMAFGPYLCAGAAAALFFGEDIISFYLNSFIGV